MQRLNPIDAIAPAFTRTHQLLLSPFQLGRTWKLCATSYLAFAGSIFMPFPIFFALVPTRDRTTPNIAAALLTSVLFLYVFYLCARLELVQFEMIVTRQKMIAPMWHKYSARVWPTILTKVIVGTVITAALTPSLIHGVHAYIDFLQHMPHFAAGQKPDPATIQAQMAESFKKIASFYRVFYSFFFLLKFFSTLLKDFVFPFYILEPITFVSAIGRSFQVFLADPLQVILYLVLKFVLSVLGTIMYLIAFLVAEIVLAIPLLILIFVGVVLGGLLSRTMGAAGPVMMIAGGVILYSAFVLAIGYLSLGSFGYLLTLLDSYGIMFLGGRYPLLGDLLEPPAPTPYIYTPPPLPPGPGEDDGGPTIPMDPALA